MLRAQRGGGERRPRVPGWCPTPPWRRGAAAPPPRGRGPAPRRRARARTAARAAGRAAPSTPAGAAGGGAARRRPRAGRRWGPEGGACGRGRGRELLAEGGGARGTPRAEAAAAGVGAAWAGYDEAGEGAGAVEPDEDAAVHADLGGAHLAGRGGVVSSGRAPHAGVGACLRKRAREPADDLGQLAGVDAGDGVVSPLEREHENKRRSGGVEKEVRGGGARGGGGGSRPGASARAAACARRAPAGWWRAGTPSAG